jgi:hypothetical protein
VSTPEEGCPRGHEVGAYLLGSLRPTERADYAAHLAHCPVCLREIGQLAGLPGLLSRTEHVSPGPTPRTAAVPAAPPEGLERAEPAPVAGALADIRRLRARGRGLVAAALVLVALLGVAGTGLFTGGFIGQSTQVSAAADLPVRMRSMGDSDLTAALALTNRPWGTQVVMRCRYQSSGESKPSVYVLVARGTDGSAAELARWTAVPNQDIVLASATELDRARLAALEVRSVQGAVLLRADHLA